MKKFFAWILAIAMTLSLAACGGNNSDQDDSSQQGDTEAKAFELSGDVEFVCPFSAGGERCVSGETIA